MIALLKRYRGGLRRIWRERTIFTAGRTATRLARLEEKLDIHQREMRLMLSNLGLPDRASLDTPSQVQPAEPDGNIFAFSSACQQACFEQPWFAYWARRLGERPAYHRKLWELVYIVQALYERGQLSPGSRGLGFGVGREALSAVFAAHGCEIVATDMAFEDASQAGWVKTSEHAQAVEALRRPALCDDDTFSRNVSFRVCDMNAIDSDLQDFDFCWSACAYEHLGSIEFGLQFVENSLATLKPGGWAIHTTELNVSSNADTIDNETTVLFRRRDFEALAQRLRAQGHVVAPFDFATGHRPMERYIDVPPYRQEPHLVLALKGYATTSFGLIIQKAG